MRLGRQRNRVFFEQIRASCSLWGTGVHAASPRIIRRKFRDSLPVEF
jgi:hypothetical protein